MTADYYPTPPWVVDRILDRTVLVAGKWLEAGAGDGAIIATVNRHKDYAKRVDWDAVELRPESEPALRALTGKKPIIGDFLTAPTPRAQYDVVIANPPFKLAEAFLHVARQKADTVCFLLRLNFLEGTKRATWLRKDTPDVFVVPDRPSFTGNGKTDSIAYAWMVWSGYHRGKRPYGRVEVLDPTPSETRRPVRQEE